METSYEQFYNIFDEATRVSADEAMRNGLAKLAELLPYALIPFIILCAILVGTGQMGFRLFTSYGARLVLLLWLVVGGAYIPYVRNFVVDEIPNEIATTVNGSVDNRINSVQQFGLLDDASAHFTATALSQATGIWNVGNMISIWNARGLTKFFIEIMFYIWIAVRMALYLVVASGAFLLLFLLFDSTRGWVNSLWGKFVGLTVLQLLMSILLKIQLGGSQMFLRNIINMGANASLERQIDWCWTIAGWFLGCLVLLIMLPTLAAVYSGAAASSAIAGGMMWNVGASMVRAGNAASQASHRMARAMRKRS